jgi:hypothetical protein
MKKAVFFVLLTLVTPGYSHRHQFCHHRQKKDAQPTAVNFTKTPAGFKRDLGSAD